MLADALASHAADETDETDETDEERGMARLLSSYVSSSRVLVSRISLPVSICTLVLVKQVLMYSCCASDLECMSMITRKLGSSLTYNL